MAKNVTSRQCQVFQMIADGRKLKQVAYDLGISGATVRQHIQNTKDRLGSNSIPSSVAKLIRRGDIK